MGYYKQPFIFITPLEKDDWKGTKDEASTIMVTALDDPSTYIKTCYECGADTYLVKPIDLNNLKRQISALIV